ncbi:hypothetical protein [Photobacterium marinum]|nr:hypothetical protein [Photobacterium marinum]
MENVSHDVDIYEGLSPTARDLLNLYGDQRSVEIETVMDELDIERHEARKAFKELDKAGNATIKIGRRGKSTRLLFSSDVIDTCRNMKMTEQMLKEGNVPTLTALPNTDKEPNLANASIEQLVGALKEYHGVSAVHLVY